jgi:hypothetical protein
MVGMSVGIEVICDEGAVVDTDGILVGAFDFRVGELLTDTEGQEDCKVGFNEGSEVITEGRYVSSKNVLTNEGIEDGLEGSKLVSDEGEVVVRVDTIDGNCVGLTEGTKLRIDGETEGNEDG